MKKLGGSCLTDKESDDETGNTHKNFGQFITKETSKKSKDKSNYRANDLIGGIGFSYESEETIINKTVQAVAASGIQWKGAYQGAVVNI